MDLKALKFNVDLSGNPRLRIVLKWVGYPALYLFFFCAFAYWSFPYDRLKQRIIAGYNATQADKPMPKRMVIGDVTWSWRFPGIVLSDVELIGPKPEPPADGKKAPPRETVYVEEFYAGIAPFSALTGDVDLDFDIAGFDGEMDGVFKKSEEGVELEVEFDGVDIGQLPGVQDTLQLPLTGRITGTAQLSVPEGKYGDTEGSVTLQVTELEVGDGETKIRGLLALPTVRVGTLDMGASISKGRVKLETFEAKGQDLDVTAEGRIRLRDPFDTSLVEGVNLAFKFSDQYRDKDDTTRSLLGKPNAKFGGAIDLDPSVKRAKGEDGFYRWRVSGALSKPSFRPDVARKAPAGAGGKPGARDKAPKNFGKKGQ